MVNQIFFHRKVHYSLNFDCERCSVFHEVDGSLLEQELDEYMRHNARMMKLNEKIMCLGSTLTCAGDRGLEMKQLDWIVWESEGLCRVIQTCFRRDILSVNLNDPTSFVGDVAAF